ncbi:putative leader peptide [Streptomyces sp. HSW2009]
MTRVQPVAAPGPLLVARLHVDLCRLASAICQPRAAA